MQNIDINELNDKSKNMNLNPASAENIMSKVIKFIENEDNINEDTFFTIIDIFENTASKIKNEDFTKNIANQIIKIINNDSNKNKELASILMIELIKKNNINLSLNKEEISKIISFSNSANCCNLFNDEYLLNNNELIKNKILNDSYKLQDKEKSELLNDLSEKSFSIIEDITKNSYEFSNLDSQTLNYVANNLLEQSKKLNLKDKFLNICEEISKKNSLSNLFKHNQNLLNNLIDTLITSSEKVKGYNRNFNFLKEISKMNTFSEQNNEIKNKALNVIIEKDLLSQIRKRFIPDTTFFQQDKTITDSVINRLEEEFQKTSGIDRGSIILDFIKITENPQFFDKEIETVTKVIDNLNKFGSSHTGLIDSYEKNENFFNTILTNSAFLQQNPEKIKAVLKTILNIDDYKSKNNVFRFLKNYEGDNSTIVECLKEKIVQILKNDSSDLDNVKLYILRDLKNKNIKLKEPEISIDNIIQIANNYYYDNTKEKLEFYNNLKNHYNGTEINKIEEEIKKGKTIINTIDNLISVMTNAKNPTEINRIIDLIDNEEIKTQVLHEIINDEKNNIFKKDYIPTFAEIIKTLDSNSCNNSRLINSLGSNLISNVLSDRYDYNQEIKNTLLEAYTNITKNQKDRALYLSKESSFYIIKIINKSNWANDKKISIISNLEKQSNWNESKDVFKETLDKLRVSKLFSSKEEQNLDFSTSNLYINSNYNNIQQERQQLETERQQKVQDLRAKQSETELPYKLNQQNSDLPMLSQVVEKSQIDNFKMNYSEYDIQQQKEKTVLQTKPKPMEFKQLIKTTAPKTQIREQIYYKKPFKTMGESSIIKENIFLELYKEFQILRNRLKSLNRDTLKISNKHSTKHSTKHSKKHSIKDSTKHSSTKHSKKHSIKDSIKDGITYSSMSH